MFETKMAEVKSKVLIPEYFTEVLAPQMPIEYGGLDLNTNPMCNCPIHQDNNESMRYYAETNTFKCFGCQAGGDVIELDRQVTLTMTEIMPSIEESVEMLHSRFINKLGAKY